MTPSEFAERIGVSACAVRLACRDGRISATKRGRAWWIECGDEAEREWRQNTHDRGYTHVAALDEDEDENDDGKDYRAEDRKWAAKLKELEFKTRAAELIEAEAVRSKVFGAYRAVRDALLRIPDRLAAQAAAEPDEFAVNRLLTGEIDKILEEMVEDVTVGLSAGPKRAPKRSYRQRASSGSKV